MLAKPLLFLSSYAPLFALLAVRFQEQWLWISCAVMAAVGVASVLALLVLDRGVAPNPHILSQIRDAGPETASYLASYLLPFVTVSSPSIRDVIAYVGFLVIAAVIYLRSPMVQVNPLLYLLGYRVLAIEDDRGLRGYLITRKPPTEGAQVLATRFRDDVLIQRTKSDNDS
ncbi:hypothetical protein [Microbispora bryophytorum]|uniref:hypothetical protein n=1 Tax=Microbispora bryophytorum TaxID=1460882 RepID=UPI0037249DC7